MSLAGATAAARASVDGCAVDGSTAPVPLQARAELYLGFARAFLPPSEDATFRALRDLLPDDLAITAAEAGHPITAHALALAHALAQVPDALALLQIYSGLFIQPPREVPLNAALYLDGAVMGRSVDRIERVLATHGIERAEAFRDTPDHLSLLLEALGCLYARAAAPASAQREEEPRAFLRAFLLSWVPLFVRQLENAVRERGSSAVYLHLARALQAALIHDAGEIPDALWEVIDPRRAALAEAGRKEMARCRACGAEIAPAGRLRRVKRLLAKEGMDVSHLDLCFDCRGSPRALLARLRNEPRSDQG